MKHPDIVYSIFDKPGEYWEITEKEYEVIIDNEFHFNSPVEIIIPTYKRSKLLLEALNSALDQDVDFKYLITVIDNDPNSSNENLLNKKEYKNRIRYIRNKENLGLFGNWNRAIQVSRAPFFALLHDDDMLEKNYLSSLTKVIDMYPDVGVVTHIPYQITDGNITDPFSNIKSKIKKNSIQLIDWKDYLYGNITSASCMLINKEKAMGINGWYSKEFPSADWFFNARMAYSCELFIYHSPISRYRWDVNTSLIPEMEKYFFLADTRFMFNNLVAKGETISRFIRQRVKITLYNKIRNNIHLVDSTNQHDLNMIQSYLYDNFTEREYRKNLCYIFLFSYNKLERIINWLLHHQRI